MSSNQPDPFSTHRSPRENEAGENFKTLEDGTLEDGTLEDGTLGHRPVDPHSTTPSGMLWSSEIENSSRVSDEVTAKGKPNADDSFSEFESTLTDAQQLVDRATGSDPWIGRRLDRYVIRKEIAHGGMGAVYLAEQVKPVRRQVALKMILPHVADDETVSRFHAERQTLAMMDHPDIAKVLDAGTAESGEPFFVMELAQGIPVDQFCDENQISLRQRIELLIRIARAVNHAHERGIIHRDIKPLNILAGVENGQYRLKLIDFGIAKAFDCPLAEETEKTHAGQILGTPQYMSPEQADSRVEIDRRCDVFALGVLLYDLLIGQTPLASQLHGRASLAEIIRMIREQEAQRPSLAFSQLEPIDRRERCAARGTTEQKMLSQIRGDLDWITLKAVEKEKFNRYATANDLADDLRRHLDNQPIQAAAPTLRYRLVKLYRRRKPIVLATLAATAAILLCASVLSVDAYLSHQEHLREVQRATREVELLLADAKRHRQLAHRGEKMSENWARAKQYVEQAESVLVEAATPNQWLEKVSALESKLVDDHQAMALWCSLEEALERAIIPRGKDASMMNKQRAADEIVSALTQTRPVDFKTALPSAAQVASRLKNYPDALRERMIETLDFVLLQSETGLGIRIARSENTWFVADLYRPVVESQLQIQDRIVAFDVNDSGNWEEFNSHSTADVLQKLAGSPGSNVGLKVIPRGQTQAVEMKLQRLGQVAFWVKQVLNQLDESVWRKELRRELVHWDCEALRRRSQDRSLQTQPTINQIQVSAQLARLEQPKLSIEILQNCQQRHPNDFWSNHFLAKASLNIQQPPRLDDALMFASVALGTRPHSVAARVDRAFVLLQSGRREEAFAEYELAIEQRPDLVLPRYLFANELYRSQNWPQAIEQYQQVLQREPEHADAAFYLACSFQSAGNLERAIETWEQMLKFETNSERVYRQLISLVWHRQDFVELNRLSDDATRACPDVSLFWQGLGVAQYHQHINQAAIHSLSRAIELDPKSDQAFFYLALVQQRLGRTEKAIGALKSALQINPDSEEAKEALGRIAD